MVQTWEYAIYVSVWARPTPKWECATTEQVSIYLGQVVDYIQQHAQHNILIDDCWLQLKNRHPDLCQSNDAGYYRGFANAVWDP